MKFGLLRAVPGRLTIAEALRAPDARPGRRGFRNDGEASRLARWLAVSLLPLAAFVLGTAAQANTLTVQATVPASCSADATTLDFGQYRSEQPEDHDRTATITNNCTPGAANDISLRPGNQPNGSRRMISGADNFLAYELYKTEPGGEIWGNNDGFHTPLHVPSFSDSLGANQFVVHGRIHGGQPAVAGTYTDQVSITVETN